MEPQRKYSDIQSPVKESKAKLEAPSKSQFKQKAFTLNLEKGTFPRYPLHQPPTLTWQSKQIKTKQYHSHNNKKSKTILVLLKEKGSYLVYFLLERKEWGVGTRPDRKDKRKEKGK